MKSLRLSLAALALAVAGFSAAGASASPVNVPLGPNKLILKLCKPHYETHSQYLGIRKIGFRFYRVYRVVVTYTDIRCHKRIIRVHYRYVPLPFFFKKVAPGA